MALLASYVEPLHGLSYVDPAYVDPYMEPPTWTLLVMWTPLRGVPHVDSPTWTMVMWTPLRGAPYVDSPTWTLVVWRPCLALCGGLGQFYVALCGALGLPYVEALAARGGLHWHVRSQGPHIRPGNPAVFYCCE